MVVPGEDNEFELQSAAIQNLDTVNRLGRVSIEFPENTLHWFVLTLQNVAGGHVGYPVNTTEDGNQSSDESFGTSRQILAGEMELHLHSNAVVANQDARLAVLARVRGEKPTFTTEGNSDHTSVTHTDRFF